MEPCILPLINGLLYFFSHGKRLFRPVNVEISPTLFGEHRTNGTQGIGLSALGRLEDAKDDRKRHRGQRAANAL